jgi:membrane protein implicated in regulation of membrane protease activity
MTWADFYLICFAAGFAFSMFSFLLGGFRWHLPFNLHLPGCLNAGEPRLYSPPTHIAGGTHGAANASAAAGGTHNFEVSPFNPTTLAAFLGWFGGTGYLLTRYSSVWFVLGLGFALLSGLVGAGIVFLFLSKVLSSQDENMNSADYEMVGVLGKICSPIRTGGTGEIIYSQAGTRRTCGARSDDGHALPKGSEVVVTRYERGIAYVRRWEEITGEEMTGKEKASAEAAGSEETSH